MQVELLSTNAYVDAFALWCLCCICFYSVQLGSVDTLVTFVMQLCKLRDVLDNDVQLDSIAPKTP